FRLVLFRSPERANLFWRTQFSRRATRTGSDRRRVGGESAQSGSTTTVVGHARPGGFRENLLMSSDIGASDRGTAISRTSLFRESVTCVLEERHGSNLPGNRGRSRFRTQCVPLEAPHEASLQPEYSEEAVLRSVSAPQRHP